MDHQLNTANSAVALDSDADYFRQLIETQPAVLMRVGLDGALLAANHAALGLLGAEHLDQLSGLTLPTCVAPEHRSRWDEFSMAIGNGTSNSFECDFTNLVGTRRSVLFHGVPLLENRDGIASVILSAHDMSRLHWSESVFENRESSGRHRVEPPEPVETQQGRLKQLECLLRDGRSHLLDLRTKLDRATEEARALVVQLAEQDASLQTSMAARAALSEALSVKERQNADLAAALAEHERSATERARELLDTEQRAQEQLTTLTAERDRLADLLDTRERELQMFAEKRESMEGRLRSALTEHAQLETLLNDRAKELETVKAACETVANERDDLQARLGRLDAETKELLPRVSAGRLALEISGDLTAILAAIDARLTSVLAASPRDSSAREDLQLLSADVFTASLLSREILLSSDRGSIRPADGGPHVDATA
jgi:PAS domain S-box-containing protein